MIKKVKLSRDTKVNLALERIYKYLIKFDANDCNPLNDTEYRRLRASVENMAGLAKRLKSMKATRSHWQYMDELYIMQKDVNRTINEFLDFAKPRA
jgi:hypothetical protein